ncbi:hypothetical protein [Amycolatopsis sp. PS_44_ISF1]|uniref:hypothetical protein n=1 Tax=Amycolatopsis sp. PS_44_ISF1 TaxID=2974917 RepID=UPI0028E0252C|nr:hypothetical protein [Amycolatopsis sp. PS_44_ISF1]MDT8911937.1 hypothetical protein [Amycolatopsis sp. PS_44_ISF1]
MLKKIGLVTAALAAGAFLFGGVASASTADYPHGGDQSGQVGLLNLNNTDLLHNVNVTPGICGNDVNVLGVQVPIRNSLNGIGVPILSPGENTAAGVSPYNCASGTIVDGGSVQGN